MEWEDLSFDWALVCVYGTFAVVATYVVCWPLEEMFPVERRKNRKAALTDAIYTIISRVGVVPLVSFLVFYQAQVLVDGWLVDLGYIPPTLETALPAFLGHPMVTFMAYATLLDCADYWRHRFSHGVRGWHALHALHHAQREMSFWSDDRNHLLDDLISAAWFGAMGLAIGIPPLQFPLIVLLMRFVESLSHANVRMSFGWLGDRLLVSPRFHRRHHGLQAAGSLSCNYGAVFPIWDILFGTASFSLDYPATGDRNAPESMATGGYMAQQWTGLGHFLEELRHRKP
jgi:sterol desaturase/sphingolipid hydroxylase (fatty acid hydroxylase superfamily)